MGADHLSEVDAELDRARRTATAARLRYANLAAAARATFAALAEGDPDPLDYLRDELAHPTPADPLTGARHAGTAEDRRRG